MAASQTEPSTAFGQSGPVKTLSENSAPAFFRALIATWITCGALVIFEPSPYEIMFLAVLPVALITGLTIHRRTLNILNFLLLFLPFAVIAAFQVQYIEISDALIYSGVTVFLWFTAFFVANFVADHPWQNTNLIMRAYTIAAVASAVIGTLGYLHLIPGSDLFVRYDRAKAAFQDPNVFGPFLIPPAIFALQQVFLSKGRKALFGALIYAILFIGVFASFSRAAWGYMAASTLMLFVLCYFRMADGRQQARMLLLSVAGTLGLVVALGGLLSIPSVESLFETRASVSQTYDTGETGRFGRQSYAFDLALQNPWGIGPLEFRNYRVKEEPHDTYVNVIHAYGWGGGLAYWVLVAATLWRLFQALPDKSNRQLIIAPLFASFIPLAVESAIIDTDHWRHFFLLVGLVWGATAVRGPIFKTSQNT